jgi:hypothetical protein
MLAVVIANAMVASGAERAFPTIVRRSTVEKSKKRCTMRYHGSESRRHDDALILHLTTTNRWTDLILRMPIAKVPLLEHSLY